MVFNGEGVMENKEEGIKYIKMSANNGNREAMIQYGQILEDGIGIQANKDEALKYFSMANLEEEDEEEQENVDV